MTRQLSMKSHWLDRLAISMAVICGIHCLVTPVLLVALPLIGTTFWVDENFHLWMLLLVIPTTTLAIYSGCRRHKDKWVIGAAALGLGLLFVAVLAERMAHSELHAHTTAVHSQTDAQNESENLADPSPQPVVAGGGCCPLHPPQPADGEKGSDESAAGVHWHAVLNTFGGLFLVVGHTRNFMLCRKHSCQHEGGHC